MHVMYTKCILYMSLCMSVLFKVSKGQSMGLYSSGQKKVPVKLCTYVSRRNCYVTVQLHVRVTNAHTPYIYFNRCTEV